MAKKRFPLLKPIPLLTGAIVLVAIIGIFIKFTPQKPLQSIQQISEEAGVILDSCATNEKGIKTCTTNLCNGEPSQYLTATRIGGPFGSILGNPKRNTCPESQTCKPYQTDGAKGIQCVTSERSGTNAECPGGTLDYGNFSLCLSNAPSSADAAIDATVNYVKLSYQNIPPNADGKNSYYYCLRSDPKDCDDDDLKEIPSNNGAITIDKLCGNGNNKLKTDCKNDGSDYFHPEKTYRVTFYEKKKADSPQIASASFYVSHFYPIVVAPNLSNDSRLNITKIRENGKYNLKVELSGRNAWGNLSTNEENNYNDYWLIVEGFDNEYVSESKCLFVTKNGSGTANIELKLLSNGTSGELTEGKYILKIKDARDGRDLNKTNPQCKENDFTYYFVPFVIEGGDKSGKFEDPIKDPYGKEIGYKGASHALLPICPTGFKNLDGNCRKINTALGTISTEPQLFIRDLFRIVLGIGGIASVVFFIQAGYTIMTSAGSKEKVGQAREQITAAIMGLIFIILSVTILEFIGVNILRLPGFGSNSTTTPVVQPTKTPSLEDIENDPDLRPAQ